MSTPEHPHTLLDLSRRAALPALSKFGAAGYTRTAIGVYWLTTLLIFASVAGSLCMQMLVALVVGHLGAVVKRRLVDVHRAPSRTLRTGRHRPTEAYSRHQHGWRRAQLRRRIFPALGRRHSHPSTHFGREE